jgi:hypothetical protein
MVLSGSAGSASGGLSPTLNGIHVMWPQGVASAPSANNLIFHGGLIERNPKVYIVYWGPAWQSGFSQTSGGFTYTNKTAMNYVNSYVSHVGGSPYAGVQTQYCQNIPAGSLSCAGQPYPQYVTNPTGVLKGTWIDPSPVPATIVTTGLAENVTNDPVEAEAVKAAQHFGYDIDATYFVLTEPGHAATAYGSVYCAYHAETAHLFGAHGARYAFLPYVPEQGAGCGQNSVNNTDDAFGHGFFDGYSVVFGHEQYEAVTDPDNFNGTQDGWNDAQTSENGDKCAWTGLQNVTFGKLYFALQPLWSNEANGGQGGCAFSR